MSNLIRNALSTHLWSPSCSIGPCLLASFLMVGVLKAETRPHSSQSITSEVNEVLAGRTSWLLPCIADGKLYRTEELTIKSLRLAHSVELYNDAICSVSVIRFETVGSITKLTEAGDALYHLDLTDVRRTITPKHARGVNYLNSLTPCGPADLNADSTQPSKGNVWQLNVSSEVDPAGCPGTNTPGQDLCKNEYTAINLSSEYAQLAQRATSKSGCTATERMVSMGSFQLKSLAPPRPADGYVSSVQSIKLDQFSALWGSGQRIDFDWNNTSSSQSSGGNETSTSQSDMNAEYEYAFREVRGKYSYYGQVTGGLSRTGTTSTDSNGNETSSSDNTLTLGGRGGTDQQKATIGVSYYYGEHAELSASQIKASSPDKTENVEKSQTEKFVFGDLSLSHQENIQTSDNSMNDSDSSETKMDIFAGFGIGRLYPAAPFQRVKQTLLLFGRKGYLLRAVTRDDFQILLKLAQSRWDPTAKTAKFTSKLIELGLIDPIKIGITYGELVASTIDIFDGSYDYRDEGVEVKFGFEFADLISEAADSADASIDPTIGGGADVDTDIPIRLKTAYLQTIPLTEATTFFPGGVVYYEVSPKDQYYINLNGTVSMLFTEDEQRKSIFIPKELFATQVIALNEVEQDFGSSSITNLNTVLGARYNLGSYLSAQVTLAYSSTTTEDVPDMGDTQTTEFSNTTLMVKLVAGGRGLGYEADDAEEPQQP